MGARKQHRPLIHAGTGSVSRGGRLSVTLCGEAADTGRVLVVETENPFWDYWTVSCPACRAVMDQREKDRGKEARV